MTPARSRTIGLVAALVVLQAFWLRFENLDLRGFCHPENYVPGLAVPSWVHDPPERTDLSSLAKSLLRDAHPPLYYVVMLPWVKAFGMSLVSIRLPSVIFGVASVLLLYLIALRETRRETALVAASLLAMHGQQIYWSQTARVYAMAIFMCLLSTFLLWKALEDGRRRWRVAYAASAIAALWTHVYCWPLVLAQILWSTLRSIRTKTAPSVLASQFAAVIVSLPVIALAIYLYRPIVSTDPPLEYFELGYLFWTGAIVLEYDWWEPWQLLDHVWLLALGIGSVTLGLLFRPEPTIADGSPSSSAVPSRRLHWALLSLAAVVAATIVAAAVKAFRPGTPQFVKLLILAATGLVLAIAFPAAHAWIRRTGSLDRGATRWLAARVVRLSPVLALFPYLCMVAASRFGSPFLERGTMLYVPFLLLVAATGLTPPGRLRWLLLPFLVAALALHAASVRHSRATEHTLRDYCGLAAKLERAFGPDDLILITNEYSDPPLLYYLPNRYGQFVPSDWAKAVAAKSTGRVWVIRYEDQQMTPELDAAVAGLRKGDTIFARGSRAHQFVR